MAYQHNALLPDVCTMAKALGKDVDELIIGVLDRERHQALIHEIRDAGARVHLVSDGDLSAGIAAAVQRQFPGDDRGGGDAERVLEVAQALCGIGTGAGLHREDPAR